MVSSPVPHTCKACALPLSYIPIFLNVSNPVLSNDRFTNTAKKIAPLHEILSKVRVHETHLPIDACCSVSESAKLTIFPPPNHITEN